MSVGQEFPIIFVNSKCVKFLLFDRYAARVGGRLVVAFLLVLLSLQCGCRNASTTANSPISGPVTVRATPLPPPGPNQGGVGGTPTETPPTGTMPESAAPEQMRLGNPDGANENIASANKYLVTRPQFALSFNDSLRFPNWVSWRLQASDIGDTERGQFYPDNELPNGFTRVFPNDYTNSGYDRGHNCPSKDRSATREDNNAVFTMINITPQAHGMNAGPWQYLEEYCRSQAREGNDIYIVCGHGFRDRNFKRIGRAGVAVPDFGWKIAVIVPQGGAITAEARAVAVEMPNISTISRRKWQEFMKTPAQIEQDTGLKFFTSLPPSVAAALRQKLDPEVSSPARRTRRKRTTLENP